MMFGWKSGKFRAAVAAVFMVALLGGLAVKRVTDLFSVPVVLSKETTYITEPLRKDGTPDYLAALNRRSSNGVTPDNNAAVLFWRAMGHETIDPKFRVRFFQMLGIPMLPEKGAYFVTLDVYWKQIDGKASSSDAESHGKRYHEILEQYGEAVRRPWSKKEFPVLADWLAANEKPLDLLIQASRRPRRYDPIVGNEDEYAVLTATSAFVINLEAARVLTTRAMLRLGENRVNDAWQDLLACHRLARLTGGEQMSLVNSLVAITMESIALAGEQAVLQHAGLTAAQIAKMRDDLAHLPPMPNMADTYDVCERFVGLDCILTIARQGTAALGNLTGGKIPAGISANAAIDQNIPLRMINSWFDRMVATMRKPTRAERDRECKQMESDLMRDVNAAKSWSGMCLAFVSPREARSKTIGLILLSLLMPSGMSACDAEDRITMEREMTDVAFALAAYRADHGSYPKMLAELTPKYVAKVPLDIFSLNSDADLHYHARKDGFLLYSVGINGKDDGGKSHGDRPPETYDPYNLAVRVNWPEKP
jgi:hypothetical protein